MPASSRSRQQVGIEELVLEHSPEHHMRLAWNTYRKHALLTLVENTVVKTEMSWWLNVFYILSRHNSKTFWKNILAVFRGTYQPNVITVFDCHSERKVISVYDSFFGKMISVILCLLVDLFFNRLWWWVMTSLCLVSHCGYSQAKHYSLQSFKTHVAFSSVLTIYFTWVHYVTNVFVYNQH